MPPVPRIVTTALESSQPSITELEQGGQDTTLTARFSGYESGPSYVGSWSLSEPPAAWSTTQFDAFYLWGMANARRESDGAGPM
jgi:hypothetical protein